MTFLFRALAAILILSLKVSAADLAKLQSSFMERYDEVNQTRDEQLKKLEGSYLGALERHLAKVKSSGDLKKVLPVRDEIEAMKGGKDALPELPETVDADLKGMREKYIGARDTVVGNHSRSLLELSSKMSAALEAQEKELTRQGKIDDALSAQRMRETLAKDAGIAKARSLAVTESKAEVPEESKAEWRLLIEESMEVKEKGQNDVGSLSDVAREGRGFWSRLLNGGDPDEMLVTPSPCVVAFELDDAITEIRGEIKAAFPGSMANVRVMVGEKKIYEGEIGRRERSLRMDVKCDSTKEITIEVDQVGDRSAWIYWNELEVR